MNVSVLHVTDSFWPEHGGVERVVENLAAGQRKQGWHVTVLSKRVDGQPPVISLPDGTRVLRYQQVRRPTPLVYYTSWLSGKRWARIAEQTQPPDLVHYHLTLSAQGPLGYFGDRIPSVATFYGPWHNEFAVEAAEQMHKASAPYRLYLRAQMALQKRLQSRLLDRATRIAALSEFSRTWIEQLAPQRAASMTIVPGGVDPQRFVPGDAPASLRKKYQLPDNAFIVLTVRRLVERMGIDMLINAVAAVVNEGRDVQLLIAGSGPLREKLTEQARRIGVAEQVHFLGYVPDEELPTLYRLADLFVAPTRAEENFGLILLEAAASGTPVAATPAGSLPELMHAIDPRYLAADVSTEALTEVLHRAVADGNKVKKHFTQTIAPAVAAQYSWQKMIERYNALYAELGVL